MRIHRHSPVAWRKRPSTDQGLRTLGSRPARLHDAGDVIGVPQLTPDTGAQEFFGGLADVFREGLVDELDEALGGGDPDGRRGAVGHGAEPGLALAQLRLLGLAAGDVADHALQAERGPVFREFGLGAGHDPDLGVPAGRSDAVLDLVAGAAGKRAVDRVAERGGVFGIHPRRGSRPRSS